MARTRGAAETGLGWGLRSWITVVVILLVAPTAIVIPMSFSASSTFTFPPQNWSLHWYEEFFQSPAWMSSLLTSFEVGVLAAVLATILGLAAALGLDRAKFRGKGWIRSLMMAPLIMPRIVVAVAIYAVFLRWQLAGSVPGFVLAHTVLGIPFVLISVTTRLAGYDRTVETAAASLGAGRITTFRRITLPLLLPGVASGFAFAFVASLDEVVMALFLQSPHLRTLPVQMYDSITLEIDPTIAAASSLLVVVTSALLLIPQLAPRRRRTS
jgi:putative spermidine/putrescine transport system permease protein